MVMPEEKVLNEETKELIRNFENLSGESQLDFLKFVIEKMENGEIEINGNPIYPKDIAIPDGYSCLSEIMKLLG